MADESGIAAAVRDGDMGLPGGVEDPGPAKARSGDAFGLGREGPDDDEVRAGQCYVDSACPVLGTGAEHAQRPGTDMSGTRAQEWT